jgi:hypothetical protein
MEYLECRREVTVATGPGWVPVAYEPRHASGSDAGPGHGYAGRHEGGTR